MTQPPVAAAVPEAHKDRGTGLIVFGLIEILCGALCAGLVPFMVFGQLMSARMTGQPTVWGQLLSAFATYGFLAVALVWLGVGSIRRRRSARALSLILGWSWLLVGLVSVVAVALLVPSTVAQMPGSAPSPAVVVGIVLFVMSCPMVVVPFALVLFYSSRHVKATCEIADPRLGWTDACPLPVLAASLWMAIGASMMLLMMAGGQAAVPVFGMLLVGAPGILASLPLVLIWAYLGWALYKLRPAGWWATLAWFLVLGASAVVTFARTDLMALYARMGYPEQQLDAIRRMPGLTGANLAIYSAVMFVAMVGYLLWIRRWFVRPAAPQPDALA